MVIKRMVPKLVRDHPFKTSACLRGVGGSPLPMFADARGPGVLGLPTSAIFESIRRQNQAFFSFFSPIPYFRSFFTYYNSRK